jgi:hypothetical protein
VSTPAASDGESVGRARTPANPPVRRNPPAASLGAMPMPLARHPSSGLAAHGDPLPASGAITPRAGIESARIAPPAMRRLRERRRETSRRRSRACRRPLAAVSR